MNSFLNVLSNIPCDEISVYCTGYPEEGFMKAYQKNKPIYFEDSKYILHDKNYQIIKKLGFDAISLWDYRKGKEGGFKIDAKSNVDSWGRIYKNGWYTWDGIFKDEKILLDWTHLRLPSQQDLTELNSFLQSNLDQIAFVLSLPGLFEKTWQSIGFVTFSKFLKTGKLELIKRVIKFFSEYNARLIRRLQDSGASLFLFADDCGYRNREFIPKDLWKSLFFNSYCHLVKSIHDKNQKVIIHSDGFISNYLETFIEIGFDAVQSLEPSAGVDIFELFQQYGQKICFIGNLDISLLIYGTTPQIRDYTTHLIRKAEESNARLIISPTQQINSKVKIENIKAMISAAKNFKV